MTKPLTETQLRALINAEQADRGATHWEGCEQDHPRCRIVQLAKEVLRLRGKADA